MVALIAFGCLYLKVDDATRPRFEAAGGVPGFPGIYFDDSAAYQIV